MKKFPWWKLLAVWGLFLVFHFAYKTLPCALTLVFGESSEAIFTHMKMVFWAYLFASIIEFFVARKKIRSIKDFAYARLLGAVAYPWLVITIWFAASALGFKLPEVPWEIIYANITTVLGIYIALRLDEAFDDLRIRPALQASIAILFALSILSYISFTFFPPDPGYFFTGP
jgi:hypothetical protein